ncbi:Cytoplasmic dynein 1 heavy chain 1, partial [Cladochytrium tenue]
RALEAKVGSTEWSLERALEVVDRNLNVLADLVLTDLPPIRRKKCEHLITELVHQRDVVRTLVSSGVRTTKDFAWLYQMRFYLQPPSENGVSYLSVRMANATFDYGYEYLGVPERLVQTPLTDRCYLTMTQALDSRLGGSPFGPAGTGKTESIFITMNPGYAGRSNLPDNLKKLFRSIAMTHPDRELIAQVMLYSQGFRTAELLASKVVPLFKLCDEQLSSQSHYDFGLRSLKSVLVSAGNLKRDRLASLRQSANSEDMELKERAAQELERISDKIVEQEILIQSVRETMVPKLVAADIPLLQSLLADVFPGVEYVPVSLDALKKGIKEVCSKKLLQDADFWLEKVIQLYQIQNIHHGLMMVGPSGSGKSSAWRVLLEALEIVDGTEGSSYVIDPKAMSKEGLYGYMDPTTREWTDGLFTHILRKIIDNVRGESSRRHWIIFDGDVDPEWVENLNSVLDDNRLLTLPNGERLALPKNVRIMFEVENLRYATLATVSRCGMVWFSEDVLTYEMVFQNYFDTLRNVSLEDGDEEAPLARKKSDEAEESVSPVLATQRKIADILMPYFKEKGLVVRSLEHAETFEHIMDFTGMRVLNTLFSLINKTVRNVLDYDNAHPDFPLSLEQLEKFVTKRLILSLVWSFAGDTKLDFRAKLGEFMRTATSIDMPVDAFSVIDYDVGITDGDWIAWHTKVPTVEIEAHNVAAADVVVPTVDTLRHEEVLYSWLSEHKPLILCGPPGSGKTMTLFAALRKLPEMEVAGLNFSSATTPELILKTFEQHCEYRKTPSGVILAPTVLGRWLVVFCDEMNLPATDKYGTQRVISFIRQLVEHGGYWRTTDKVWVKLERIQFVGACNPPTDPGRVPLSHRYLRHAPLLMVDYPGEISLNQIYNTFCRATLKLAPSLRGYADALTGAMVEFYLRSQKRFTPDIQAHYIYSPRELTRWIRGIHEALRQSDSMSTTEELLRVWAHEALRLFRDRLVSESEREWTDNQIDEVASKYFPNVNVQEALTRPILYSNWLSKNYVPVSRNDLREFVKARLKVFYEEELDVPLVLFNDVLEHVLRIDRVFRQMQGHLLLIGVSGSGKTTLSRFVAWMNGLSVFQIKAHNKYTAADFDDDLRGVLRRAGCKGEKICFIMDESNVLDSGFLERINTLLANGEVPGLFEGDEFASLMSQCKEGAQREGSMLDSAEELFKWFTFQVMKNLHIVFTMNPPEDGLASRAATSPALFNRCVLDWFGDWSDQAFYQVGKEFTDTLDLDLPTYIAPSTFPAVYRDLPLPPLYRDAVINAFVFVHMSLYEVNAKLSRRQGRYNHVTPRHYLDFINHYVKLFHEKRDDLEEQQRHLNVGLEKMRDTVVKVEELRRSLAIKNTELEAKNKEAEEKLKKMFADQKEAEEQKRISLTMQEELAKQNVLIEERKKIVMSDLANAEPAVKEAQASVSNIKKQHLTEVRSMGNPPEAVKLAMESVCTLIGHKIDSWKSVQGIIRKDDFITSIVNYDTNRMSRRVREDIMANYISNPSFNFETVNRASKACGPLVQWVIAQVKYADILERVGPLRKEVEDLETSAEETRVSADHMKETIAQLEESILHYKEEYAVLISETQLLKSEMEKVKSRVDRSLALLDNLSSENDRWDATSQSFEVQMGTIVGDVLLSSAFLAYGGYFDQQYRSSLLGKWMTHLQMAGIQFKHDLSIPEYLSNADERLKWQENSLPADDLCTENAIMLKRFNRYPLIIDPSGQATTFLLNSFKDRKISVTSFLDDSFLKVLESSLRFGNPLLVQDVENLDPILNAVLNKEFRRTGGRVLIRLGNQEIDFSPSFMLFLSTRDPSVNFPPDICSRVTFVNFTVTRGSLQSQCLHQVLKAERPDTDKKRTDLVKVRGEFQLRLRHLEKLLLQALNESKGNILDDDNIIATLETLKQEAAEITKKVEDTDVIMQEVETVTATYTPLAQACSSIYFTLEQLSLLNHFYQFSLDFFTDIFQFVLHQNPNLKQVSDHTTRLNIIMKDLFAISFQRSSRALLHDDQAVFGVSLAYLKLKNTPDEISDQEYDYLTNDYEGIKPTETSAECSLVLGEDAANRLGHLSA